MTTGHANQDELNMIHELEARIDPLHSPVDDLVRLGQLYICPMHDDERATEILRQALERDQRHPWAIYWLAYIQLWDMMDRDSLLSAKAMLESWLESAAISCPDPEAKAAILQRLAQVRDSPDLADLSDPERVALLEESVRLAPHWANNRWYLGRAYTAVGRTKDAEEQLEAALANLVPSDPAWDAVDDLFEADVTGRTSTYIAEDSTRRLQELRR